MADFLFVQNANRVTYADDKLTPVSFAGARRPVWRRAVVC